MRYLALLTAIFALSIPAVCRDALSYAPEPPNLYVPEKNASVVTLYQLISSRPELSSLASVLNEPAGFAKAFDTTPTWKYTFFAPSNTAFNNTNPYFSTFADTKKGKWWLGNLLQHHYVPNTAIGSTAINNTLVRFQTGTYMYVSVQKDTAGDILLNKVAKVTEANIEVTNGIVHIIDHILDPAAQIFERDLPKLSQAFIAGSCSNPALPYC